jgi:23S rRNA G2445 N2-methylase RlmL
VFAVRTARWFGVELAPVGLGPGGAVADAIARALAGPAARAVFSTWTEGVPRVRVAVGQGGHRRKVLWAVAERLEALTREVVNDPRESLWEAVVSEHRGAVQVVLSPRALEDPRFSWRVAEVPASSHPTVAAALAQVAGVRDREVLWDPFVGAGAELVERSLLGPCARIVGTDRDPEALAAARANLGAAGVTAVELLLQDARETTVEGLSLALTNPPLGSRVGFGQEVPALLEAMVPRIARQLVPGGRLVWLSPVAERTRAAAERAGLRVTVELPVALEGLQTALQRIER